MILQSLSKDLLLPSRPWLLPKDWEIPMPSAKEQGNHIPAGWVTTVQLGMRRIDQDRACMLISTGSASLI